jgi:hypothetical protein
MERDRGQGSGVRGRESGGRRPNLNPNMETRSPKQVKRMAVLVWSVIGSRVSKNHPGGAPHLVIYLFEPGYDGIEIRTSISS